MDIFNASIDFLGNFIENNDFLNEYGFSILYGILCGMVGVAASGKGRSGITWALISFFITPVLGGFFVAFMRNEQRE
jgi:hypothetical protein